MDSLPPIASFYNNDAVKSILRDEITRPKYQRKKKGGDLPPFFRCDLRTC